MAKASLSSFVTIVLNVAWYFVAVGIGADDCLVAVSPWIHLGDSGRIDIPVSFDVDTRAVQVSAPALGVSAAEIQHVRGSMSFPPPSRASVTGLWRSSRVMLAFILWVLGQLIAVFRSLRDRQPFVPDNAIRIRRIGYAVIAWRVRTCGPDLLREFLRMTHFSVRRSALRRPAGCERVCDRARTDHPGDRRGLQSWNPPERRPVADNLGADGHPSEARPLLLDRRLTLTELADRIGITIANLSVLKTNKARAIRFSTLEAICRELKCQPGDLLEWIPDDRTLILR